MNDELSRAISIAQTAHDHNDGPADNVAVAIGALIRAVMILAGEQPRERPTSELEASTAEGLQAALSLAKRDHMAAQTALDNVKDKLQRTEQDLGARNDRVRQLEAHAHTFDVLKVELQLAQARERALEKRIADLTTPPTVDGKTPGQVDYEAYSAARLGSRWEHLDERTKQWNEAGANAVLRAFGRPNQLTTSAVTDALERVADTANIGARRLVDDGIGHDRVLHEIWHDAIRDELSRLQTEPSQPAQTNAVDALKRVRGKIGSIERMSNDTEYGKQWANVADLVEAIDDEIANLETRHAGDTGKAP